MGGKIIATLIISFISIAVLAGTDQFIKIWAIENLKNNSFREFIKIGNLDIMHLNYLENDGAVFGSFSGMRWILVGVTAVLMVFCIWYMIKHRNHKFIVLCMTLIVGGGLGNIIDRVFRNGRVVDYLDLQLFNFAIFNFADCCVTVGAALLLIYMVFIDKNNEGESEKAEEDERTDN